MASVRSPLRLHASDYSGFGLNRSWIMVEDLTEITMHSVTRGKITICLMWKNNNAFCYRWKNNYLFNVEI